MRTAGIRKLVEQAVARLPKPHTEDVIDDAFHAIEQRPEWREQYEAFCKELGKSKVNTWGGFWIANWEGRSGTEQTPAAKSTLIETYPRLTAAANKAGKKVKEPAALKLMWDHFQANKASLPKSIVQHRDVIVELIMEGFTAEEAFAKAPDLDPQPVIEPPLSRKKAAAMAHLGRR
jgi:hypothetical protein